MSNMTIDYDGKAFIIKCPMWANELVRELPNRRWNKSKMAWVAPILRANVVHLQGLATMGGVTLSDNARSALDGYGSTPSTPQAPAFPHWYRFKRAPRKHQLDALNKGYDKNGFALFMDMQTGKSKTAIDMIAAHRMEGHIKAALIITKKTLRLNWVHALNDDCPIPFSAHLPETSKKKDFSKWMASKHDFKILVVGWESLSTGGMADICREFALVPHEIAIIADETNYITGHKATRSKVAVELSKCAKYRYALTGTPATEGPMNLFMQFEFLDPQIIGLGDYYAFRNRYAVMGGFIPKEGPMRGKPVEIVGYQNMDELLELIGPYSFQVMKSDAYDLPPKRYQVRDIEMTKAQKDLYKKIKSEKAITMGDDERAVQNTLELMLRLHQVAGGYTVTPREIHTHDAQGMPKVKVVYDPVEIVAPGDNPKILELVDIVNEAKGKQGLIWAVYMPEIKAIVGVLRGLGLRIGELHGGIPESERQPMVDAFKRGEIDWVVGNASTGGMGYSMHTAEVSVFYNNTFKLRDRLQAEDRCWGDGQTKPGIWIDLISDKTVDMTVFNALAAKEDMHNYIRHRIRDITKLLDGEE